MIKKFLELLCWGALATLGSLILISFFYTVPVMATSSDNVSGWAWSDNIGWISFNSTDTSSGINYGVNVNETTGNFSGYAWSDNVGWINFPTTDCPRAPCRANLDKTTGAVTGWMRVIRGSDLDGGWDGWIELAGTNHSSPDSSGVGGVTYDSAGKRLVGYAWGGEVVGWIDFSPAYGGVLVDLLPSTLSVSLSANPSSGIAPLTSALTATVSGSATGDLTYTFYCGTGVVKGPFVSALETASRGCLYSSRGSYVARVTVQREGISAEDSRVINVSGLTQDLNVSCSVEPSPALVGEEVTWSASVSGGSPPYTFLWSGDVPTPPPATRTFGVTYSTVGTKTANVLVTDSGPAGGATASCENGEVRVRVIVDPDFEEF